MDISEGLFTKLRVAMMGQDNSIFETPDGRVLAFMNPAGNLIVERCYGERQSLSVEPNDEVEAWKGTEEEGTFGEWTVEDADVEDMLAQLGSVVPVVFDPPDPFASFKVEERPTFPGQILDPAELSPGMRIGVQTVADGKTCRATLTVAEISTEEGWVTFDEWTVPTFHNGVGKEPQPYSLSDLGLTPYSDGRWHRVHHCFTAA